LGQRARYGLPASATLRSTQSFATHFGASFHLQELFGGVEVYGGTLIVTVDPQGRVTQVGSSLFHDDAVKLAWNTSLEDALKLAAKSVPFPSLRSERPGVPYGAAKQYLFDVGGELHAGWLVHPATFDPTKNWYVAVDAVTGQRLFVQNRVHHAALDAQVYPISPGGLDAGVGVFPLSAVTLTHADGGSLIGDTCDDPDTDGGRIVTQNDAGQLCGEQIHMFNCCPSEGCKPDAGPKHVQGATSFNGYNVQLDIAVCDRLRRASNQTNATGDYVYTPVDPPANAAVVDPNDPANSDPFAEVHAFYHVNQVYDWVRGLSATAAPLFPSNQPAITPFKMRDERNEKKVALWANVMFPDFNEIYANPSCVLSTCTIDHLLRIDNAAFFPRENFSQLPIPGFDTGVDTLLIFQGNSADAAYDATVIQHEFGHGVVYATAALTFDDVAMDAHSANNEGGALHEGFADYVAAAFNNLAEVGPYFGPRVLAAANIGGVSSDRYLRTMNNTFSCPSVLWGEVHQDSQHVAGALWDGRKAFQGTDLGHTYDAAFYAMLVSIPPTADFATVATVMTARVKTAFPSVANAESQMQGFFAARAVVGCDKVNDVTTASEPWPYFGIVAAPASLGSSVMPGPFQFLLQVPQGATAVHVKGTSQSQSVLGGAAGAITVMTKVGQPVTFTRGSAQVTNDADKSKAFTPSSSGAFSADLPLVVPCAADQKLYVALGSNGGATLTDVSVTFDKPNTCPVADAGVDAGTPDAGTGGSDAGLTAISGGVTEPAAKAGCGCNSAAGALPFALLGLMSALRRRRQH
jgi:uncharacterized protein (TIGR03382 family)